MSAKTLTGHLKHSFKAEQVFHEEAKSKCEKQLTAVEKRLNKLTDLLLDELISPDEHKTKRLELLESRSELRVRIDEHEQADNKFRMTLESLVHILSSAYGIFMSSSEERKRQIINFLFTNLQLNGKKLEYTLRSPFHLLANLGSCPDWSG